MCECISTVVSSCSTPGTPNFLAEKVTVSVIHVGPQHAHTNVDCFELNSAEQQARTLDTTHMQPAHKRVRRFISQ